MEAVRDRGAKLGGLERELSAEKDHAVSAVAIPAHPLGQVRARVSLLGSRAGWLASLRAGCRCPPCQ